MSLNSQSTIRTFALGIFAVALTALGADAPTQTVDAGGLKFEAPAAWKSSKPSNAMRRAQLKIAPAKGDEDSAELVVTALNGAAGGLDANIKRWQGWFKDEDGKTAKIETKTVKGKNVEVVRLESSGRYVAPVSPGSSQVYDKPNYRLLGAMISSNGTSYFLRLIGPDKTVVEAREAFDAAIASMTTE